MNLQIDKAKVICCGLQPVEMAAFFNEDPWNLDLTLSSVSSLFSQLLGYYGLLVLNPEVC